MAVLAAAVEEVGRAALVKGPEARKTNASSSCPWDFENRRAVG
jgi:hypothetical protein